MTCLWCAFLAIPVRICYAWENARLVFCYECWYLYASISSAAAFTHLYPTAIFSSAAIPPAINHPLLYLLVRLLQFIIHHDFIMNALFLRKRHLHISLLQALLYCVFTIRASSSQSLLQDLDRRGREEQKAGVEMRALDLFDSLHTIAAQKCLKFSLQKPQLR